MKPHANIHKKTKWSFYWGDKVKSKFKRIFSKSHRQSDKKLLRDVKMFLVCINYIIFVM